MEQIHKIHVIALSPLVIQGLGRKLDWVYSFTPFIAYVAYGKQKTFRFRPLDFYLLPSNSNQGR